MAAGPPADDPPDPAAGADPAGFARTRLRTVQLRDGRTTLRLEAAAWRGLETVAASRRTSARFYIQETADLAAAAGLDNRASVLRARIMADLAALYEGAKAAGGAPDLAPILHAAPAPAFALTPEGALAAFNDEMAQFIKAAFGAAARPGATLSLRFARPIAAIEADLAAGGGLPALAHFTLRSGEAERPGRARLALVRAADPARRRLVGFVQA